MDNSVCLNFLRTTLGELKIIQIMFFTSLILVFLISLILFLNHWSQNKGIVYLVVLILAASIRQIALLILHSQETSDLIVYIFTNLDPIYCLIGPCVLYYFKSLIRGDLVVDKWLLLHGSLALLVFINTVPFYLLPFDRKLEFVYFLRNHPGYSFKEIPYVFFPNNLQKIAISIINVSYCIYSVSYVNRIMRSGNVYLKKKLTVLLNKLIGVLVVCVSSFALFGFFIIYNYADKVNYPFNPYYFLITLVLPLSFFLFPSWLYGDNEKRSLFDRLNDALKITFSEGKKLEAEDFGKKEDLNRIMVYVSNSKPYLNDNFSLHDISRALNIPHVRVTNCFNKQLKVSFPVYRNKLRVDYATSLLVSGVHLNTSIEGIASKSGFKSKSAFYLAFKSAYGVTPIEWIKMNL